MASSLLVQQTAVQFFCGPPGGLCGGGGFEGGAGLCGGCFGTGISGCLLSSVTAGFTFGLLGGKGLLGKGGGASTSNIPSSDKAGLFLPECEGVLLSEIVSLSISCSSSSSSESKSYSPVKSSPSKLLLIC